MIPPKKTTITRIPSARRYKTVTRRTSFQKRNCSCLYTKENIILKQNCCNLHNLFRTQRICYQKNLFSLYLYLTSSNDQEVRIKDLILLVRNCSFLPEELSFVTNIWGQRLTIDKEVWVYVVAESLYCVLNSLILMSDQEIISPFNIKIQYQEEK